MQRKKWILISMMVGACLLPLSAFGFVTEFHGYAESRGIFRDYSGFQNGFMNDMEGVQWIQELQLDLDVAPSYLQGAPPLRFEKAFFRYRGAYDAIFALTSRYNDIRKKSPDDFELGKDDLRIENDLREAFLDFVGEPGGDLGRANLRLGRQIVQWGEADGFNLINIVNPNDNRNKMFFSNPEDLLTPLWMGRLDVRTRGLAFFDSFNLQFLVIPDIRPVQFAPLDGKYNAPYAFLFKGFAPLPAKEDVPNWDTDHLEYGVRVGTELLGFALFGYYFGGYQDSAAVDFRTAFTEGAYTFRHPRQDVYGMSFNKWVSFGNFVFRGEGSVTMNTTQLDLEGLGVDPNAPGYTKHDFYQLLFGFDKTWSTIHLFTDTALTTAFQIYMTKIADWDENSTFGRNAPEEDMRFTFLAYNDYNHGTISPTVFVMYDIEHAWMTNVAVNWCPDGHFYVNLSEISFFGDADGKSAFAPFIETASEVGLKIGYRW